jgi:DNA-binding SARP family transcriptional activator
MDKYIPEEVLDEIAKLTEEGKYDEAIEMVNRILTRDPKNEQALLMIADIQYRQGNME